MAVKFGLLLLFCSSAQGEAGRVDRNRIDACPATPNCVSSRSLPSSGGYVAPLQLTAPSERAWNALTLALSSEARTVIADENRTDGYIHAEAGSLIFGFVDDLELQILPEDHLIHIRSASRTGYWDLGVNRRRVDRITSLLREAHVVR